MAYTKQQWQNGNTSAPYGPINGARLQHIEDGLDAVANGGALPAVTIAPTAANQTLLTLNTFTGQTADLVRIIDPDYSTINSGLMQQSQLGRLNLYDPRGEANPELYAPEFHWIGRNAGKNTGFGAGLDVANAAYRNGDFAIFRLEWTGAAFGAQTLSGVTDSLYASANVGVSVPTWGFNKNQPSTAFILQIQPDTALTSMGGLRIHNPQQTQTGKPLSIYDTASSVERVFVNPYPDYGLTIIGDSITTPIGPAFIVQDRSKAGGLGTTFKVDANGRITSDQTGTGNTSDVIWAHTTQAGATLQIASRGSGAARTEIWTGNNADLILGTNGVARLTIAKTTGGLAQAFSQTLAGATTDVSLATHTPVIAGAFTADRLNYQVLSQPTGAATITDAAVFRFDAAIGTHKAVDSGTTKTSPGTVTAWIKVNLAGTIHYMPAYASKTT